MSVYEDCLMDRWAMLWSFIKPIVATLIVGFLATLILVVFFRAKGWWVTPVIVGASAATGLWLATDELREYWRIKRKL